MVSKVKRRGRPAAKEISETQRRTLEQIEEHIRQFGYPPTILELAGILGITGPSTHDQVNQLVRKGYLRREPRKARGLSLIRSSQDGVADLVAVPLVGAVAAGHPIFVEQNCVGEVLVEGHIAGRGHCFALEVAGDSMKNAGIGDRDIVVVRQQQLAEHGDIVVAAINGETTVKRLHIEEQIIELRPDNARFQPIHVAPDAELRILGKVVAVRRVTKTSTSFVQSRSLVSG